MKFIGFISLCPFVYIIAGIAYDFRKAIMNEDWETVENHLESPLFDTFTIIIGFQTLNRLKNDPKAIKSKITALPKYANLMRNFEFYRSCAHGEIKTAEKILASRFSDLQNDQICLYLAAEKNHVDLIKFILTYPEMYLERTASCDPVVVAMENSHEEALALLLSDSRLRSADQNKLEKQMNLIQSCAKGDYFGMRIALMEGANPGDDFSCGFMRAAEFGHLEIVQYLVNDERVDVAYGDQYALRKAYDGGHFKVVKTLVNHVSVKTPVLYFEKAVRDGQREVAKEILKGDLESYPSRIFDLVLKLKYFELADILLARQEISSMYDLEDLRIKHGGNNDLMRIIDAHVFVKAARENNVELLLALKERVDVTKDGSRALKTACYRGNLYAVNFLLTNTESDPSIDNQQCLLFAAKSGNLNVVKRLLKDSRVNLCSAGYAVQLEALNTGNSQLMDFLLQHDCIDPSVFNQQALVIAADRGFTEVVKELIRHPKVDVSIDRNRCFRLAITNGHSGTAKVLFKCPRFVDKDGSARTLVIERAIREALLDSRRRKESPLYWKNYLEDYVDGWGIAFDFEKLSRSFSLQMHSRVSSMEKFITNVFFDSHSIFFEREDIRINDYNSNYLLMAKMVERYLALNVGISSDERKAFKNVIDGLNQIHKTMQENRDFTLECIPSENKRRRDWINRKLAGLSHGESLTLPLRTRGHVSIGLFKKSGSNSGNFYIFNSGDGTSRPSDTDNNRLVMFEVFGGVSMHWFIEMFVRLGQAADPAGLKSYRSDIYPPKSRYTVYRKSESSIRGQKSGTCKVRSIQLYMQAMLGKPLYMKLKTVSILDLLASVYKALDSNDQKNPVSITYLGEKFETCYLPVWTFVQQSRLFEELLQRQSEKLAHSPVVLPALDWRIVQEKDRKKAKETAEWCKRKVTEHLKRQ